MTWCTTQMDMGLESLGQLAGELDGESLQTFLWGQVEEELNEKDGEERKGNHACLVCLSSFCSLEVVWTGAGHCLSDILEPTIGGLSHLPPQIFSSLSLLPLRKQHLQT